MVGWRGAGERSVHYASVLTFDGPCSSVSKTKAGPDGHLMCTAIYCQSGRGKQRAAVLLQLPLQRSAFMEITCMQHVWGGAKEKACVYNCMSVYVWSATPLTRSSAVTGFFPQWAALTDAKNFSFSFGRRTRSALIVSLTVRYRQHAPLGDLGPKALKSSFTAFCLLSFLFFVINDE